LDGITLEGRQLRDELIFGLGVFVRHHVAFLGFFPR
jgi:hypothetical protein